MTAFIKCKLSRVVSHKELLEQGLDNFPHSVGAADVEGVHTAIWQVESSFLAAGSTPALAGLHSDGSAQLHLHLDEASVNPIGVLQRRKGLDCSNHQQ